jgi:hypothetical protein
VQLIMNILYSPPFIQNHVLTLDLIITQAKLIFMHSVKYDYSPKSFINVFVKVDNDNAIHDLRYPNDFVVPRARIELFKKVPLYSLPYEWNNCGDLRFYRNTTTFKIALCDTLFCNYALKNNIVGE